MDRLQPKVALMVAFATLLVLAVVAGDAESPVPPRLEAGRPLEAALPGDKTALAFTASFTPDRDGPWTFDAHSDYFDIRIGVRRILAEGHEEALGRAEYGGVGSDARLTVDARAGEVFLVVVRGDELLACGESFSLLAEAGTPPARCVPWSSSTGRSAPRDGSERRTTPSIGRSIWPGTGSGRTTRCPRGASTPGAPLARGGSGRGRTPPP